MRRETHRQFGEKIMMRLAFCVVLLALALPAGADTSDMYNVWFGCDTEYPGHTCTGSVVQSGSHDSGSVGFNQPDPGFTGSTVFFGEPSYWITSFDTSSLTLSFEGTGAQSGLEIEAYVTDWSVGPWCLEGPTPCSRILFFGNFDLLGGTDWLSSGYYEVIFSSQGLISGDANLTWAPEPGTLTFLGLGSLGLALSGGSGTQFAR